jgi:hypothetical protein
MPDAGVSGAQVWSRSTRTTPSQGRLGAGGVTLPALAVAGSYSPSWRHQLDTAVDENGESGLAQLALNRPPT